MRKLSNLFIALLLYIFRAFVILLPDSIRIKIGRLIGRSLILLSGKRKRITLENIRLSSLDLDDSQVYQVMKESYENLGITLVELMVIDKYTKEELKRKIKFKNLELIKNAHKEGNGVILLSAHYGNWELLAYAAGIFLNNPINIVVKYQMNPYADKMLRNLRKRGGNKLFDMKKAAISMVKLLKSGDIVALLADQRANKDSDLILKFLGRDAIVYRAPGTLALKMGSPVIIGFAERDINGTYTVDLKEIKVDDSKFNEENVKLFTEEYLKLMENQIKKVPGQWAWQHNRWEIK